LAKGEAPVTLCAPGGKALAESLAAKLGVSADFSDMEDKGPEHAFIIEELCIGCTRCIRECTSDSILGANKLMHTIIADTCHSCGKCVEVCPTEAIVFVPHYEASTYNRANLLYDLDDLHRAAPKEPIATGVVKVRPPQARR
jgi:electron transport complex protein RnfB